MFINGAIFAKAEEKGRIEDIGIATVELCRKFDRNARKLFPLGGNAILGITAAKDFISTHLIASANGTFSSTPLKNYNLQFINGRAEFVVDLIKFMRYVSGIPGPQERFHLIPDVRNRTENGHHVTWTVDGLVKEFHRIERIQMERIQLVYDRKLENVEHGVVYDERTIVVSRVGYMLQDAINRGIVRRDEVVQQIKNAIYQLHEVGLAHCDICVRNVFVDMDEPHFAFLDDLEYLTALNDPPPNVNNCPNPPPARAEELDIYQMT
eukprot:gene54899-75209_t